MYGNTRQKVINLFAGPGTGKSTGMAYIFSKLKMLGINCEMAIEYAKTRVWQNDLEVFQNQLYVIGKQTQYMSRLKGKVDVIITDSPIIMGSIYCKDTPYYGPFHETLKILHHGYENYDYFLNRVKPYNPAGRFQNEYDAKELDDEIKLLLYDLNGGEEYTKLPFFNGDQDGYDAIVEDFLKRTKLGRRRK